jgi:putative oxidoreductase
MRIATLIARVLLGLMFVVVGLNGFLNFIPQAPMPAGLASQFLGVLLASHFMVPVFLLQIASGLLFLVDRHVPLALTLIAPVIVNILLIHVLMNPDGIVPGAIATVFWIVVFLSVRSAFDGILGRKSSQAN